MLPEDSIPASVTASTREWSAEGRRRSRSATAAAGMAAAGEESSAAGVASSETVEVDQRQRRYWERPLREERDRGTTCDPPPASRSLRRLQFICYFSYFFIFLKRRMTKSIDYCIPDCLCRLESSSELVELMGDCDCRRFDDDDEEAPDEFKKTAHFS